MTDVKIGDRVFINNSMRIWEVTDIEGESAYITSEGFGSIWMALEKLRPAIAAGHRIDIPPLQSTFAEGSSVLLQTDDAHEQAEAFINRGARLTSHQIDLDTPPNATISPIRDDLPKDVAMVQDGDKEAVIANKSDFNEWWESACEFSPSSARMKKIVQFAKGMSQVAWQHQQAVVDELRMQNEEIRSDRHAHVERVTEKLCEEMVQQAVKIAELQKRVDEALGELAYYKSHVDERNSFAKLALKDIEKALGANHESN